MRTNMIRTMAVLALMSSPLALHAQRASARAAAPVNDRAGYSLSLGLGGGSSTYTCAGCPTDRENGASGYLRVGKGMTLVRTCQAWCLACVCCQLSLARQLRPLNTDASSTYIYKNSPVASVHTLRLATN